MAKKTPKIPMVITGPQTSGARFWQEVYIAAIRAKKTSSDAGMMANSALDSFRKAIAIYGQVG